MKTNYRHHWGGGGAFLLLAAAVYFLMATTQAGTVTIVTNSTDLPTGSGTSLADAVTTVNALSNLPTDTTFTLSGSETLPGTRLNFVRPDKVAASGGLSGTYTFVGNGAAQTILTGAGTGGAFNNYDNTGGGSNTEDITGVQEFVFRNLTIKGALKENTTAGGPGGGAIQMSGQIKSSLTVNQEAYNHRVDITLDGVTLDGNKVVASGAGAGSIAAAGGLIINGGGSGVSLTNNFRIINNEVLASMTGGGHFVYGGGLRVFNTNGITVGNGDITGNKAEYSGGGNDSWVIGGGAAIELDTDIAVQESVVTFTNTKIERNTASNTAGTGGYAQGGGLYLGGNIDDAANANLVGNKALSTTLTGVTLSDNTATAGGSNSAYGGGIAQNGGAATRINAGTTISGNKAIADAGNAKGGGIYASNFWRAAHPLANLTIESATFTSNSATSTSGAAQGGAIWSNYDFMDTGSTFTGNTATGNATHGGQGGAIWSAGDVTLTNSKLTGNSATGTNAAGGAIYMDTSTANRTLSLRGTGAGGLVEFTGNTAGNLDNSIHFATSAGTTGTVDVAADAGAAVHILDAISASGGGGLTVQKTGAGNFTWDGKNVNDAATTVNITDGTFDMGSDFTLAATNGKAMSVNFTNVKTITFDAARDEKTAIFDFTGAGGKTLAVTGTPKTILSASAKAVGSAGKRPVYGFDVADYLLVSGMTDPGQGNAFINAVETNGASGNWTYVNKLGWENNDPTTGRIVANAGYDSPFEHSGNNTLDAIGEFNDLVNNSSYTNSQDDTNERWENLQKNARAVTPEIAMQATNVMLAGVMRVQSAAVDYGVRNPHRLRMRMEDSYTRRSYRPAARRAAPAAAGTATATTDPVTGETMIYQQGMLTPGIENYQAYPAMRLEDCYFPGVGLRLWAGYTGDWKVQREHSGISGYDASRHGVLLGVNYDIGTVASVGVYGGYTNADVDARGYDAEVDADNGHFGIISRVSPLATMPELSFYADAGYHFANNDSVRRMGPDSVTGSFDQDVWTFGLGAEYVIRAGMFNITPQADFRFNHLTQDGFTETPSTGNPTATRVDGLTADQFTHRLGAEFSYDFLFAGGVVTPALSLGWRHDWGNRRHDAAARYVILDPNATPFGVAANPGSRDSVDIGLAVKSVYNITSSTKLGVNLSYNLNLGGRSHSHAVYAGVELGF